MKKLKVVILSALVMTGLAGCGGEKEAEHQHTFSTEWTSNETQHWHAATCEHTAEKADVANHVDANHDGKCDVCSREGLEVKHVDSGNGYCSCGAKIKVESVELDTSEAKLAYALGAELDTEGVKLVATYTDGSSAEISFTASADLTSVGTKVVTLEYDTEDETGSKATITYNVTVSYWSEEDLEILSEETLLGWNGLTLPYLPGMKIDYTPDGEGNIESWNVLKEGASLDDLQELYESLSYFEEKVIDEDYGIELTYKFAEVVDFDDDELAFIEDEYGFAEGDFVAFRLAPTYIGKYGEARAFTADEYFIAGLTSESELKVFDRYVDALFEGYFGETGNVDGEGYDVSAIVAAGYDPDDFLADAVMVPYYYYSEFAEDYMKMPSFGNEAGFMFFTSFKGVYAFDPYFDDFDMAIKVDYVNGSQAGYEEFITNLLKLGYEKEEGTNKYTLENAYLGTATYNFYPYSETFCDDFYGPGAADYYGFNSGFAVSIYYTAPGDEYVTKFLPEAERVVEAIGHSEDANFEGDSDYLEEYAYFYIFKDEEELNPVAILSDLVSKLPADYCLDGEPTYVEEDGGYYLAYFTNGYTAIELVVSAPDVDGDVYVQLCFFEGYEILETFVNKIAAFADEAPVPLNIQIIPQSDGYIVGTVLPVEAATQYGMDSLMAVASYIAGSYFEESGLVVQAGNPSGDMTTSIVIPGISTDGKYNVNFNFTVQTISEVECYVVQIYVKNAIWSGTAEELMIAFASKFGGVEMIEEKAPGYAIEGVYFVQNAYPVDYEEDLVTSNVEMLEGILPGGMVRVQDLAKDVSTGVWSVVYTTADGTVTLKIEITWTEMITDGYVPLVNIYTYPTPVE